MEGFGDNDMNGIGTAVSVYGESKVEIKDCRFHVMGVTRPAFHAGGSSFTSLVDVEMENFSPESDWLGRFCWQISLRGSNRLTQLADFASVDYLRCKLKTNGWGVLSLDGCDDVKLHAKDSEFVTTGPFSSGYSIFCMGPNAAEFEHCKLDASCMALIIFGMSGKGRWSVLDGSEVISRRFGFVFNHDDNSILTLKDSKIRTKRAALVVKGSASVIDIDNCDIQAEDGVLVQMMDNEESGQVQIKYVIPVGVEDVPMEGRDLSVATVEDDVILNLSNMTVKGNIYNSSTNIHAERNSVMKSQGRWHDTVIGLVPYVSPVDGNIFTGLNHDYDFMHGPHNLGVNMKNAQVTGVISAAVQAYPEGVTEITPDSWQDISNIVQTAAKPVNNGVVVSIDGASTWSVPGTSYITALTIEEGGKIEGVDGKKVSMTVDGAATEIKAGSYKGEIVLTVA